MIRLRNAIVEFGRDVRHAGIELWHDRAAQIVILLSLLPWAASLVVHQNPGGLWIPFLEIGGIILIYWFFTRRRPFENLPVRRPIIETCLCLILVAVFLLYRIAEYLHLIAFPPVRIGLCDDLLETIVPKTLVWTIGAIVLFLALGYGFSKLGLGLPVRTWLPALLPLFALLYWGLSHQKPEALLTRTGCYYLAAGLPEELLFRGLLLSRLEVLTGRPAWALFLSGLVFGIAHIPIDLHGAGYQHIETALESAFTYQMSVGLALGFAFQRSRNLWPLTIIHALIDAAP